MASANTQSLEEARRARDLRVVVQTYHQQKTALTSDTEIGYALRQLEAKKSDGWIQRVDHDYSTKRIYVDIQLPVPLKDVPTNDPNSEYRYIIPDKRRFHRLVSKVASKAKAKVKKTSCKTPKWFVHEDGESCLTRAEINRYVGSYLHGPYDIIPVIIIGDKRYTEPLMPSPGSSNVLWCLSYHFQEMGVLNKSKPSVTKALRVLLSLRDDVSCPEHQTLQKLSPQVYITAAAQLNGKLHFWERALKTEECVKEILRVIREATSERQDEGPTCEAGYSEPETQGKELDGAMGIAPVALEATWDNSMCEADEYKTRAPPETDDRRQEGDRNPFVLRHFCNMDINLLEAYSRQDLQHVNERLSEYLDSDKSMLQLFPTTQHAPQKPYNSCKKTVEPWE